MLHLATVVNSDIFGLKSLTNDVDAHRVADMYRAHYSVDEWQVVAARLHRKAIIMASASFRRTENMYGSGVYPIERFSASTLFAAAACATAAVTGNTQIAMLHLRAAHANAAFSRSCGVSNRISENNAAFAEAEKRFMEFVLAGEVARP